MKESIDMTTELPAYVPTFEDRQKWAKHTRRVFDALSDGNRHSRQEIEYHVGSKNLTARVSNLRQLGFEIECTRGHSGAGDTYYQIVGYTGVSTTRGGHCPTCTCGGS